VIKLAETDEDIENCFDVMSELRPNLIRKNFLLIVRQMEKEGFQLAYIEEQEKVIAVAGFRIATNLFMGRHLYVDDLVTSEQVRSNGYGKKLINWLQTKAEEEKCNYFHLDSGTQRDLAHKFYFTQGFSIVSYHFNKNISAL
jgi:GNAT superfamily N-acetyltransferase